MTEIIDSNEAIGNRLHKLRIHLAAGQKTMAAELEVSTRSYTEYERGQRDLPLSVLRRLIELHDINPCWLITGIGPVQIEINPVDAVAQANSANRQCLLQARELVGQIGRLLDNRLHDISKE